MSRPQAESAPLPGHLAAQFVVDANVLAHAGLTWERKFSEIRFERLIDVALSPRPVVAIELKFGLLAQRPVVSGEMRADIELMCQRCMQPMVYAAHEPLALMLIESESELPLVPESHEPWIANPAHLNLLELIEEQLLLALPLIAKHADARDCTLGSALLVDAGAAAASRSRQAEDDAAKSKEVQRPFGNLRQLLRKD